MTVRIGSTGPIGCGKSTVAGWLGERPGVVVIDADVVARERRRAGRAGARRRRRAVRSGGAAPRTGRSTGRRSAGSSSRDADGAARPRGDHRSGGPAADPARRSRRPRRTAPPAWSSRRSGCVDGGLGDRLRRGLARDLRPDGPGRAPRRAGDATRRTRRAGSRRRPDFVDRVRPAATRVIDTSAIARRRRRADVDDARSSAVACADRTERLFGIVRDTAYPEHPMPDFKFVAPFEPTGDQPAAIERLTDGLAKGAPPPDAARRDRHGQDLDARLDDRRAQQADAGPRPQQDARRAALRRVPRVLPRERGRVLRQLLRLLPARGVPAAQRHLHREGLVAQRRDRPAPPRRDPRPVRAARRDHRRVGVAASTASAPRSTTARPSSSCGSAASTAATPSCATSSTSSTSATTPALSRARFRVRGDTLELQPASEEILVRVEFFGDVRSSGSPSSTR